MQCRAAVSFAFIIVTLTLFGCGDKTHPVEGQVVFEDGAPAKELAGYTIMLQSLEHKKGADGKIGSDGGFTVGTFRTGDGAMSGKQRVAITPPLPEPEKPIPPQIIDKKYGDFETSKLEIEIKSGRNQVVVKVERLK